MSMKLSRGYTFWFVSERVENKDNYVSQLKKIGSFSDVDDFWKYYQHMARPDKLPEGTTFYCFTEGVMPMWEDAANVGGGRFQMRVKIKYSNRFWEDLLLGLIGNQCEFNSYINGISLQAKDPQHIVIQIWVKDRNKNESIDTGIKNFIMSIYQLNEDSSIEYRDFAKQKK
ncbi:eukaryotic translation initiation factor 4E (macronuclear) [Tetrahymena thermophila SB210]|uniref:Eukaryotic translation initiation factor 4E n=1 Tax=Tetrahymena thermophila (strain SB210) TaxID=312017 RepID=Q23Q47_TETTS|nr:eukaryotic translation initiation factor 4E [Tetrahymena thermophila SB210]EAR98737.2 eukaryotic translation initiation factor 4E [Tetrahymena thermophila SB210]|eukprot:XP_001018982.2 eukaryotic translation initiation factor 4E [Tetrahymena thermophila SB210]